MYELSIFYVNRQPCASMRESLSKSDIWITNQDFLVEIQLISTSFSEQGDNCQPLYEASQRCARVIIIVSHANVFDKSQSIPSTRNIVTWIQRILAVTPVQTQNY